MGSLDYHDASGRHDSFEFFGAVDRANVFDGDDWFSVTAFLDAADTCGRPGDHFGPSTSSEHGVTAISYASSDADDVVPAATHDFAEAVANAETFYFEPGVEDGYSSFQGSLHKGTLVIAVDSWENVDTDALAVELAEYAESNTAFLSQFNVRIEDIDTVIVTVDGTEQVSFRTHSAE